tara:strand:- start:19 stop:267 length:249 start_codon:yes stop_codon:yes gene_type:complete
MNKTSTNNDIIKYIYNELEETKKTKLNFKILTDSLINDEVSSYLEVKEELDRYFENPSERVIDEIKTYASSSLKQKGFLRIK